MLNQQEVPRPDAHNFDNEVLPQRLGKRSVAEVIESHRPQAAAGTFPKLEAEYEAQHPTHQQPPEALQQ